MGVQSRYQNFHFNSPCVNQYQEWNIAVLLDGYFMLIGFKICSFVLSNLLHSEAWTVSGAPLDLHDPRLLAMAAAERHLLEAEYDEYADSNASGAAFCRSAALIVRHYSFMRKFL